MERTGPSHAHSPAMNAPTCFQEAGGVLRTQAELRSPRCAGEIARNDMPRYLCAILRRPFALRLARILRPAGVLILLRKPCVLARFSRLGCQVRFGIAWIHDLGVGGANGASGVCASGARTSSRCPKSGGKSNSSVMPVQQGGRRLAWRRQHHKKKHHSFAGGLCMRRKVRRT